MKIIIRIIIVLFVILIEGCCMGSKRDVYYEFNSDEMSWQIYKLNDTLLFENQIGTQKKYIVLSIKKDTLPEMDKFGSGCDIKHRSMITTSFARIHDSLTPPVLAGEITFEKSSSGFYIQMHWESVYGYSLQDNSKDTLTIDGFKYTDLHTAKVDTTQYKLDIWRWFYSKSKGITRFDASIGDVWTRKFN